MIESAINVMLSGGPVMIALAITSLLLYKTIIGLLIFVRKVRFDDLAGERLRLHLPEAESGGLTPAELQIRIIDQTLWRFRNLLRGRLRYAQALIIAAPLLGLLGTVEGMLATFRGLSLQLTQEITRTVADGISRALITTETGLFVAIPALFLINWVKRESQRRELSIVARRTELLAGLEN